MLSSVVQRTTLKPSTSRASAIAALVAYSCDQDGPAVLIPHPESHFVLRFGPAVPKGVEIHAFGAREIVHRKVIRSGQRTVTARLQLGTSEAALGVPAAEITGRVVALEDLWGDAPTRRLYAQLAEARDPSAAAILLDQAIAERVAKARNRPANLQLALAAADKLIKTNVNLVALDLGISERHLRRVFYEAIGVSPKMFTKLSRFHHAIRAARAEVRPRWANIAVSAGYYDQAHLIADFRTIAGATPRAFMGELCTVPRVY